MSSINFDNVYLLLIAIPVAVLLAIPFFWAVRKDNANIHNVGSGVLHLLIGICIVIAMAGATVERTVTETDVYVLADVSYSSDKNLDTIDEYIDELNLNLPRNSKLGVVCFAKEQQLLVPLGKSVKSVKAADFDFLDNSETDIEGALDYASTLFREGVIKRIVLITDGKQTHVEDSNALKRAVDALRADDILVDAVYLDNNISSDDVKEVQMVSAVATQNTYCGKEEYVTVTVRSSFNTKATIYLYQGNLQKDSMVCALAKGNNEVAFALQTDEKGTYEYEVRVVAERDENQKNNKAKFSQTVSDVVNVLLISASEDDNYQIEENYKNKATVTVCGTEDELPITVEEMCVYDEIIINNVDLTEWNHYELFLQNLDKTVSSFGKSLITVGNVHTQDKEEELGVLQSMLSAKAGNTDGDAKLYTIVIDASSSMATSSKLNIAKSAAVNVVDKLSEKDWVYVVTFNGNFQTVQSPTQISDDGGVDSVRSKIKNKISKIETEHGTAIGLGLEMAYKQLISLKFDEKQIMLISDGKTFANGSSGDYESDTARVNAVAGLLAQNYIPVSVIDVGRGTVSDAQAEQLLKVTIAKQTNGKYILCDAENKVQDAVFGAGIIDDLSNVVIEENANINVVRGEDAVMKGVELAGQYVTGFVYSKAKSGSTTVLEVLYERGTIVYHVPLYSYWGYGRGRVATFATSLSGISEWRSDARALFVDNVRSTNIPDQKANYPFVLDAIEEDGYVNITVTPEKVSPDTTVKVTLSRPGEDNAIESHMTFATSCYKYSFSTYGVGKYDVTVEYHSLGTETYTANYTYYVSYLPEYDSFAVYDIAVLYKMIGTEGTVMNSDDVKMIVNDENMIASYELNLTLVLLAIAIALFVVDIIVRKIKWEDIQSLFGKVRK